MKNAYVLDEHYGDDGYVAEGRILFGVAATRFAQLEKAGLVREATAEEVKKGYTPPFEKDANADIDLTPAEGEEGEKKKPEPANKKAAAPANKGA